MSTPTLPDEIERLTRFSLARLGQFGLALVQVNDPRRRDELLKQFSVRIAKEEGVDVQRIDFSHVNKLLSLRDDLHARLAAQSPLQPRKTVLALVGLDHLIVPPNEVEPNKAQPFVVGLNLERDGFRTDVPYPLLLWLTETAADTLFRHAPDFSDWITSLIRVAAPVPKPLGPPELPPGAQRESRVLLSLSADGKPMLNVEQRINALQTRATELREEGEPAEPRLAQVLQEIGELYATNNNYGQLELAIAPLNNAITMHEKQGNIRACAESQLTLSKVEHKRNQNAEAERLATSALAHFVELDDEIPQARALYCKGSSYRSQDKYSEALAALHLSRQLCSKHKQTADEAYAVLGLGVTHRVLGEFEIARGYFNQASKLFRTAHLLVGEAHTFAELADLYRQTGRADDAARCLRTALELYRKNGYLAGEAHAVNTIGNTALQQGHFTRAQQAYQDSVRIFSQLSRPSNEASSRAGLSHANYALGDRVLANVQLGQAIAYFQSENDRYGEAVAYWWRGEVCFRLGELMDALEALRSCLHICTELGLDNWISDCREKIALLNEQLLDTSNPISAAGNSSTLA